MSRSSIGSWILRALPVYTSCKIMAHLKIMYCTLIQIYFEDGRGNAMNEDGLEPVDEEAYPLDNITTYDSHLVL
ncbi:hypothetical protein INT47_002462 [Mucor saturninus]|uniref:Uncharacterized protein n=1 Tax=Mucor saturninus TaxID=64648 RepID=A0A8H7RHC2_9FUNG|nr:hypothetical protein INT47_002462 [Mucor saturninus]